MVITGRQIRKSKATNKTFVFIYLKNVFYVRKSPVYLHNINHIDKVLNVLKSKLRYIILTYVIYCI